jgi:uncharacterized protein with HEPN domain
MSGRKALRVADYIGHIIAAIDRVVSYVFGLDQAAFLANTLVQDAIIRNLEVIGEAANNIRVADPAFMAAHPSIELESAYRMRNALAHGYYTVNLATVWTTVQRDLPTLKAQMELAQRAFLDSGGSSGAP